MQLRPFFHYQPVLEMSCAFLNNWYLQLVFAMSCIFFPWHMQLQITKRAQDMCNFNPFFLYHLHFFLKCRTSNQLKWVTLFSRNGQLRLVIRHQLYFSQEMCNSNRFSKQVALFSRNVQLEPDRSELAFSQETCKSYWFSISSCIFLKNEQL
jgi:hypothetical protein